MVAAAGAEVQVLDSRRLGGAWVLDRVWAQVGIGEAVRRVAAGRRLDADVVERVLIALVAQQAREPGSKLAEVSDDQAVLDVPRQHQLRHLGHPPGLLSTSASDALWPRA